MSLPAVLQPLARVFRLDDRPRSLDRPFDPDAQREAQRRAAQTAFLDQFNPNPREVAGPRPKDH